MDYLLLGCKSPHILYIRFLQIFLVKGQLVNILGFTSHIVSVKITHFYFCSMKAAMETLYRQGLWLYANKNFYGQLNLNFIEFFLCVTKYYSSVKFSQTVKSIWTHLWAIQKQMMGWIWLAGHSYDNSCINTMTYIHTLNIFNIMFLFIPIGKEWTLQC